MESLESRLNFTTVEHTAPSHAIKLKGEQSESYYQGELIRYCDEHGISTEDDNCSAMIMSDYGSEAHTDDMESVFWFWVDKE